MPQRYVTLFRSRLRPGIEEEYAEYSARMNDLARTMPGFVSIDSYRDDAGNRMAVVEFESHETAAAWRKHPEHVKAQQAGRERFYEYYHGLVCTIDREYGHRPDKDGRSGEPQG